MTEDHPEDAMNKRKIILPLLGGVLILFLILAFIFAVYEGWIQITSTKRPADRYGENIPKVISEKDTDHDGIDDQTDILQGALSYIQTRPKYKSRYYASGYPDDGYGVCTDVVAYGLKAAGFDLQKLVDEDIKADPQAYHVDRMDANIDFRRVRNLSVFFKNHAQALTLDVHDISQWQGGDIVIFENHIGIVSDRRNARGVPYVIHHNSPFQINYEEDILEKRDDITGHYRME